MKGKFIVYDFNLAYDYSKYLRLVKRDFRIVKDYFPLLKLSILPTIKPKEIYLTGDLIPFEVLKKCNSDSDIERYSIYIMATYPSNYKDEDIYVEDIYRKIDWSKIPDKHKHWQTYRGKKILCTHHEYGEINSLAEDEKSLAILFSAWKLYIQYCKYLKNKRWVLKDLRHGSEAIKQLKRMGEYYGP